MSNLAGIDVCTWSVAINCQIACPTSSLVAPVGTTGAMTPSNAADAGKTALASGASVYYMCSAGLFGSNFGTTMTRVCSGGAWAVVGDNTGCYAGI